MSITGGKSFNNSNISGTNLFSDLTQQININTSQIAENTNNLTGITYDANALPVPRTTIDNEIYTNSIVCGGALTVDNSLICNSLVEIEGKTTINDDIDMTGTITVRNTINPTEVMNIYYNDPMYGFVFSLEVPGKYMYFLVKDPSGNYKSFQFNYGQVYTDLFTYINNWLTISYNNQIVLGDANHTGVWFGASQKYVPNDAVTSGLVFYNKGLDNNTAYYTNFTHNDLSNVETPTLRMNYANIWSKVKHIFENGIDITGNMTLIDNIIVNSTTITPTELSYIDGTTSNIQTQLNSKPGLSSNNTYTGTNTFSNSVVFNNFASFTGTTTFSNATMFLANIIVNSAIISPIELSYINNVTSNIQTQLDNKCGLSSNNTFTGTNTFNNTVSLIGDIIANSTTITPVELSYIDGTTSNIQTQLNSKPGLSSNNTYTGTNTFNNNITLTGNMNVGIGGTTSISPAELACLLGTTSNIQSTMIMKAGINTYNNFTVNNTFPSITVGGQNQTVGYNSTTAGYTLSGSTLTFPTNTVINCAVGGIGNEIRCHKFNCYNIVEFSDLSIQATAYTNIKDTKLSAIGTVVSGTLTTSTLTTGGFYSAGSISLTAGTWVINTNACFTVITGSTDVGQLLACPSTSNTAIGGTSKLSINHLSSLTCGVGHQWVLTSSNIYTPSTTTTYYCLVQATFGSPSRLQFTAGNSNFEAYRIA